MTLTFTRLWIIISTFLVSAGWLLSMAHHLDRLGYGIVFAIGLICGLLALRKYPLPRLHFRSRRFRRALPLAFLILACLVLLSGILYAPNNYDALSYRVPRTLHWLAEGRWHWIHTDSPRLNTRAADCEWIMAPLLLFARSERWLWLTNAAMFAALPGLIFSTFTRAGVCRKVAWHWMWILPTGYVFLLQAGGISNDLPGAFYALAAVALALRASATGSRSDLWLSVLAIALSQGVKASNAPLALPWLIASFPARRPRPLQAAPNRGRGAPLRPRFFPPYRGAQFAFLWRLVRWQARAGRSHEVARLGSDLRQHRRPRRPEFHPAHLPPRRSLERFGSQALSSGLSGAWLAHAFEGDGTPWHAVDLQIEDSAPLGFGVSLLLLFAAAAAVLGRNTGARPGNHWLRAVRWSPWLALLVFVGKVGLIDSGRLIAPYYLLLPMAIVAGRGQTALVKSRSWRALVAFQFAVAAVLLITPSFAATLAGPHYPRCPQSEKAGLRSPPAAANRLFCLSPAFRCPRSGARPHSSGSHTLRPYHWR